jgi:hypothetical protein
LPTEESNEEVKPEDNIISWLRESARKRGYIHSVLMDQSGRIIAGETRKKADPNWPEKVIIVEDDLDFHLKKISDNIHGTKDEAWWKKQINDTAKALVAKERTEPGKVAKRLAELLEVSFSRIEAMLAPEYKNKDMQTLGSKGGKSKAEKARDSVLQVDITKGEGATQSVAAGTAEAIASITGKPTKVGSKTPKTERNPVADFTALLSEIKVYPETAVSFKPGPEEVLLKKKKPYVVDFLIGNIAIQLDKKVVINPLKEKGLWKNHKIRVVHIPTRLIYQERETLKSLIDAMANYWNPSVPEFRKFRKGEFV